MKIVGLMLSSNNQEGDRSYTEMVKACRDTWADDSVYEVYGDQHDKSLVPPMINSYCLCNNKIIVNTKESRENLLRKTISGMRALLDLKSWHYLFRPNCGSYINIHMLQNFLSDKPRLNYYDGIRGYVQNGGEYASGSCILFSRDVVKKLVENEDELEYDGRIMMDDVAIGNYLIKNGTPLYNGALRHNCRTVRDIEDKFDETCYHYYFCHTMNPSLVYRCEKKTINGGLK